MGIEHIDETAARARNIILSIGILFRVGDHDIAIEITNPERRIASGNVWIREWKSTRLKNKILVVSLNLAGMKIRHIEKAVIIRYAHRDAFVNRVCRTSVHRSEGAGVI
jgi:hypothetical protein